jgi:hypothetical protein
MMNLCVSCGSELPDSARFCPRCGHEVGVQFEPTPKPETRRRASRNRAPDPPVGWDVAPAFEEGDFAPSEAGKAGEYDPAAVADGEWLKMAEELFPIAWLTMVVAVCYIGIYFAVETLPGQNLLPGPGWFS